MRQSVKNSTKSKISTNVNMKRGSDSEGAAEMQHGPKVCRSEQARWEHLQRDLLHRRSVHGTVMAERCAPTWVKVTRRTSTSTVDSGKVRLQGPEECSRHRPQAEGCRSTGRAWRSLLTSTTPALPSRKNWQCQALGAAERKDRGSRSHTKHLHPLHAGWTTTHSAAQKNSHPHRYLPKHRSKHGVTHTRDGKSVNLDMLHPPPPPQRSQQSLAFQ